MDIQPILAAFFLHKWLVGSALLIGLLVRASKEDVIGPVIPARVRPWLALVLGLGSGVLNAVVTGTPWTTALLQGVVAGIAAITGHEVVIESLKGGKEFRIPGLMVAPGSPEAKTKAPPPFPLPLLFILALMWLGGLSANSACSNPQTVADIAKWTGTAEQLACMIALQVVPADATELSQLCFDGKAITQDVFAFAQTLSSSKKLAKDPKFAVNVHARETALTTGVLMVADGGAK